MKYLVFLLWITVIVFIASPYYALYQLDATLVAGSNDGALSAKIDIESIRREYKADVQQTIGTTPTGNASLDTTSGVINLVKDSVNILANTAVDTQVDVAWVRGKLTPENGKLFKTFSYGFFESPTRFLVRIGKLGNNPVHFYLTLQDWTWRVTAVYP